MIAGTDEQEYKRIFILRIAKKPVRTNVTFS